MEGKVFLESTVQRWQMLAKRAASLIRNQFFSEVIDLLIEERNSANDAEEFEVSSVSSVHSSYLSDWSETDSSASGVDSAESDQELWHDRVQNENVKRKKFKAQPWPKFPLALDALLIVDLPGPGL